MNEALQVMREARHIERPITLYQDNLQEIELVNTRIEKRILQELQSNHFQRGMNKIKNVYCFVLGKKEATIEEIIGKQLSHIQLLNLNFTNMVYTGRNKLNRLEERYDERRTELEEIKKELSLLEDGLEEGRKALHENRSRTLRKVVQSNMLGVRLKKKRARFLEEECSMLDTLSDVYENYLHSCMEISQETELMMKHLGLALEYYLHGIKIGNSCYNIEEEIAVLKSKTAKIKSLFEGDVLEVTRHANKHQLSEIYNGRLEALLNDVEDMKYLPLENI